MMTIERMNYIRDNLNLTYQRISDESGVPIGTVQKVLGGITKNPRLETLQRLSDTLEMMWRHHTVGYTHDDEKIKNTGAVSVLRESMPVYGTSAKKEPHYYTIQEREAFPDDRRTELIDGIIYDMAAPYTTHQVIAMEVYSQIRDCIQKRQMPCLAFMAPTDVVLKGEKDTVVQPDVFVICDRSKITRVKVYGAPDYVLEVLSASTRKKDMFIKGEKYAESGVKEYWMIDPDKEKIIVYDFSAGKDFDVSMYGFSDKIPLAISEGKCVIDMNVVREVLEDIYGE